MNEITTNTTTILTIPVKHIIKNNHILKNELLAILEWQSENITSKISNAITIDVPINNKMVSLKFVFDLHDQKNKITYMKSEVDLQLNSKELLNDAEITAENVNNLMDSIGNSGWNIRKTNVFDLVFSLTKEKTRKRTGIFNYLFFIANKDQMEKTIKIDTFIMLVLLNTFTLLNYNDIASFTANLAVFITPHFIYSLTAIINSFNKNQ